MAHCGQACPYNTLGGCKVKEYNAICPLTNIATPITEYRMTNADRIRAMTDEELAEWLCSNCDDCNDCVAFELCNAFDGKSNGLKKWLKQPVKED